jgi:glycolate oxidase FAD binding subunit
MSLQAQMIAGLENLAGVENVITQKAGLAPYTLEGLVPGALVKPRDKAELAAIMKFAVTEKLMTVPWGGGSKMSAGNVPSRVDLVVHTGGLTKIIDEDLPNLSISVEAGLPLSELQRRLGEAGRGFFLPLDPPGTEKSTVGGLVATNAGGPRRFLYGTARDHILGLKFISPQGQEVAAGGKTVKNVAGYDLTKLLIGSWGTLGIISEITFKVLPLPERKTTFLVTLPDLAGAWELVRKLLHSFYYPAALELFSAAAARRLGRPLASGYLLAVAFEGFREDVERFEGDFAGLSDQPTGHRENLQDADEKNFWKDVYGLADLLKGEDRGLTIFKFNVPPAQLPSFLAFGEAELARQAPGSLWTSNAGSGIVTVFLPSPPDLGVMEKITRQAAAVGGNFLLLAAPWQVKEKYDVWGLPGNSRGIMKRIKEEFDPAGIMNHGRFISS